MNIKISLFFLNLLMSLILTEGWIGQQVKKINTIRKSFKRIYWLGSIINFHYIKRWRFSYIYHYFGYIQTTTTSWRGCRNNNVVHIYNRFCVFFTIMLYALCVQQKKNKKENENEEKLYYFAVLFSILQDCVCVFFFNTNTYLW